jgi:hypothetical protein
MADASSLINAPVRCLQDRPQFSGMCHEHALDFVVVFHPNQDGDCFSISRNYYGTFGARVEVLAQPRFHVGY